MTIFTKLYTKNKENASKDILKIYTENGSCIVNYLYFANLISNGILGKAPLNKLFLHAITSGDFLLPDGIALQMYYKKYFGFDLPNLNGTDFSLYFLQSLKNKEFHLILYGAKPEVIEKAAKNIGKKYGIQVSYFQDGYSEFDFTALEKLDANKINILMVGLGTPKQEIWVSEHHDMIQKYNLLVFTQGGTFDFWAGNEKRAPKIFLFLKLEWLWRLITNPKKNFKKVWYSFYLFYYLKGKKKK